MKKFTNTIVVPGIIILMAVWGINLIVNHGSDSPKAVDKVEVPTVVEKTPEPVKPAPTEITLASGLYVAGEDFPEGKYDVVAISGTGNVSSSNMYSGGLNQIMSSSPEEGFSIKEYKNAKLVKGTELTISNVKIKLIKK